MRAVRKNGEVLGGSYMVGVKWAVGLYMVTLKFQIYPLSGPSASGGSARPVVVAQHKHSA